MSIRGWHVGRLSFYAGMQGRGNNGDNPPWLGFYYGSWWPVIRFSKYCAARCVDGYWLCFHATLYLNNKNSRPPTPGGTP